LFFVFFVEETNVTEKTTDLSQVIDKRLYLKYCIRQQIT